MGGFGALDLARLHPDRFCAVGREHGRDVRLEVSAGGHDREYWKGRLRAYLRFYADALERC